VPVRSLPLADLILGIGLLATIGFAAMRPWPAMPRAGRLIGCFLVAVPLPLVVAFRLAAPVSPLGNETAFVSGVLAFALGALLLLSRRRDFPDETGDAGAPCPPWWPEFESEFRAYARRQTRSRVRL
jgi:hypothetical protein